MAIAAAIVDIEAGACFSFVDATPDDTDYILFEPILAGACKSTTGYTRGAGEHKIKLNNECRVSWATSPSILPGLRLYLFFYF